MRYLKKKTVHLVLKMLIVTALASAAPFPFAPAAGAQEWEIGRASCRERV